MMFWGVCIVNIVLCGYLGGVGVLYYVVSKVGVFGLICLMVVELWWDGINVNCVVLGMVEMWMMGSFDEEMCVKFVWWELCGWVL